MDTFAGSKRNGTSAAIALLVLAAAQTASGSGLTVLHSFDDATGAVPMGRLLIGQDGRLYGTTSRGGTDDRGVIFALKADGTEFQVLGRFGDLSVGYGPLAGVIQRSDGSLYGSAGWSPTLESGAIYRIGADGGNPAVVHAFNSPVDGHYVTNELLEASDGRLYGVAQWGGPSVFGTVFAWNPADNSYVTLKSFGSDGQSPANPQGRLVEGPDGRLYGTTPQGGPGNAGTVFAMKKDGTELVVLLEFASLDSRSPGCGVIVGTDGRLYGVTSSVGGNNIVFTLKTDGSDYMKLHQFNQTTEGVVPSALIQGPDGRLYGACSRGGPAYAGSLFALNTDGSGFEVLHFMSGEHDGFWPEGGLVVGQDGRLYGTNSAGGADGQGTVFAASIEPNQPPEVAIPSPLNGRLDTHGLVYLVATHAPTSFTFEDLPAWMSYNDGYGYLSGVPDAMGDFTFMVTAANAHGLGSKEIVLKVGKKLAQILITADDQPYDGSPKSATVTTNPEGIATVVTYNGSTTPPTEIGTYTVVATIDDPTREGMAQRTMKILDPAVIAPFITVQPASANVEIGKSVTFTVQAVGATPLTYQWRRHYADIPGATDSSYTISSTTFSDEGDYSVVITNPVGFTWSNGGSLRVFDPPAILAQPTVKTAVIGGTVSYSVSAIGTGPFTYQWRRNGVAMDGATDPTLTLTNVQAVNGGNYSVVVTNAVGSVTSAAAALTIDTTPRLINVSCRGFAGTGDDTLVMGFYISGTADKTLLIRGIGPKLADYISGEVVSNPRITVYRDNTPLDSNDDWEAALSPEFARMGAFELNAGSKDAAMTITLAPGGYTVHLVNNGPVAEGLIEVYDLSRDLGSRLTNVSCRLNMKPGQLIILGTALIGSDVSVLARNVGPGLAAYLPEGATVLADPHLRIYRGTTEIAVNDDWEAATGAYFGPTGAFSLPDGSKDAAVRVPFTPGGVTVHATGNGGTGGIAIIELYESP